MAELPKEFAFLHKELLRLRGDPAVAPQASVVIPVNAQKDLTNIYRLLSELARYSGGKRIELILVINNFPVEHPPAEIDIYRQVGLEVLGIPRVEHDGGVAIAARIPGIRVALSALVILFDADCRIPNPTS